MASGPGDQLIYEFGSFRLDPAERLLARDGKAAAWSTEGGAQADESATDAAGSTLSPQ